jgi:hypothetical protein
MLLFLLEMGFLSLEVPSYSCLFPYRHKNYELDKTLISRVFLYQGNIQTGLARPMNGLSKERLYVLVSSIFFYIFYAAVFLYHVDIIFTMSIAWQEKKGNVAGS